MPNPSTARPWRADPLWRPAHQQRRSEIPQRLLPWLMDSASLTERILDRCHEMFCVRLRDQRRMRPFRNEARVLGMRAHTLAIVRQVHLMCGATPWVYARTIIPPQTFTRLSHRFTTLGARSLGAMLFSDPTLRRDQVEVACLTPHDPLYERATIDLDKKPDRMWGRRSIFWLGGNPLLVCEFFLPAISDF